MASHHRVSDINVKHTSEQHQQRVRAKTWSTTRNRIGPRRECDERVGACRLVVCVVGLVATVAAHQVDNVDAHRHTRHHVRRGHRSRTCLDLVALGETASRCHNVRHHDRAATQIAPHRRLYYLVQVRYSYIDCHSYRRRHHHYLLAIV